MADLNKRPKILVVEDIDWIRAAMKNGIEREGYRALEATNDADALDIAEQESIELILTEEELPTFESLLTRLSLHPGLRKIPVVIINPDAKKGSRYGAAYLLTDYDEVSSLVASLVRS
jgi:CheY-like chemotaxis protein